jgi:hypothetical protein
MSMIFINTFFILIIITVSIIMAQHIVVLLIVVVTIVLVITVICTAIQRTIRQWTFSSPVRPVIDSLIYDSTSMH